VTAIAERRRRSTLYGFFGIVVLMIGAAAVFVVGIFTLSNSQDGEAVGVETRPVSTLPVTPNALLAVEDDDGALVSLTVMTLLPDGSGGSIVGVPVNADATAAFGPQRRPLDELYAADDPVAFTEAVQEMLSITIERSDVVTTDELAALVPGADGAELAEVAAAAAADEPDTTDPDSTGPDSTDPDSTDPETTGPDTTDPDSTDPETTDPEAERDSTITDSTDPDTTDPDTTDPDTTDPDTTDPVTSDADEPVATPANMGALASSVQDFWADVAAAAPVADAVSPTLDEFGRPLPPTSVGELASWLMSGPVQSRTLASRVPVGTENPTDVDTVIVDRRDANLVFAQVSPALVSTPNLGRTLRIVAPFSDEQITASEGSFESTSELMLDVIGSMLFFQANVVSVDTEPAPGGAAAETLIEVAEARFIPDMEAIAPVVFGESKVVLATTLIDGIDAVVTLGTDYISKQSAGSTSDDPVESAVPGDSPVPDDSTVTGDSTPPPGDTVAADD
jgi:hypothetical protein